MNLENDYLPFNEDSSVNQTKIRSRNKRRVRSKLYDKLLHEHNSPKDELNRTIE